MCLLAILYVFFGEMSIWVSAHFSVGLLAFFLYCMFLYFGNEVLVSQFVGCLFILFMVSFPVQKHVHLIWSHLFIFALFLLPWETDLRKHWYDLCQRIFCLWSLIGVLWCHVLYLSL